MVLTRLLAPSCWHQESVVLEKSVDGFLQELDDGRPVGELHLSLPRLEAHVHLFEGALQGQVEDRVHFAELRRTRNQVWSLTQIDSILLDLKSQGLF